LQFSCLTIVGFSITCLLIKHLPLPSRSPTVKNKMTKEEFMRNNRGIDNGKDIDPAYLR